MSVTIEGLDALFANLDAIEAKLETETDAAINVAGDECQKVAKANARVDTGEMRDKIVHEHQHLSSTVTAGADHSIFNEYGTVHMSAQPMMRPGYIAGQAVLESKMKGIL